MEYYKIRDLLVSCSAEEIKNDDAQYVAVLNSEEWGLHKESFGMLIDIDPELSDRRETKAIVNYDSLTGCFSIPDRNHITGARFSFAFALDEKGIVLIDDEGYAGKLVQTIQRTKKWQLPSLERFFYDFLERIIAPDLYLLESMEDQMNRMEEQILKGDIEEYPQELNDLRGDLLDLRVHYEQMIDLGRELEENENGFFRPENLRFFRLFTERVERLQDTVSSLRDYVVQLRDLIQSQLSVKQNKIVTHLTLVTTIFMPLTLIAGWYGMNFRYMPELELKYAYLAVILISAAIVVGIVLWFKKKKWM